MRRNRSLATRLVAAAMATAAVATVVGCTHAAPPTPTGAQGTDDSPGAAFGGTAKPAAPAKAVDKEVTFVSGGLTIGGSLRVPPSSADTGPAVPAVVLLAGSGPTDRNGDSKAISGSVGTLAWLAERFAAEGVASLRYDKLGSGKTGVGQFASHPNDIGFDVFVNEARDALSFLGQQPGIDPSKLIIGGHSEGGLIAMVVAADPGGAPAPVGVALFSPPGQRYLDLVSTQVRTQTAAAVAKGAMSRSAQSSFDGTLDRAVAAVRSGAPLPGDLPQQLTTIFNPGTSTFLQQADRVDPLAVAAQLGAPHHVLVTCAEEDIQVACADVASLHAAFPAGAAALVSLPHTDHVLKDVGSSMSDGNEYATSLPFSADLAAPLHELVESLR